MKKLKDRIYAGETVHGCWLNLASLTSAEIVGDAGFDWVLIDLEHGAGDLSTMYQQLQVLKHSPATALVRTDELSRSKVQRILDAGATGVMFPQIRNAEEAAAATRSMYYPPKGTRGMAKAVRATGFGVDADQYISSLEANLISIVQIETVEAINNIQSIASTESVDVLFVGPNDLSLALGVFGQLDHPDYQDAIRAVSDAAKKYKKTAGVLLQNPAEYSMYSNLGFRFLACGADGSFVTRGAREMAEVLGRMRGNRL